MHKKIGGKSAISTFSLLVLVFGIGAAQAQEDKPTPQPQQSAASQQPMSQPGAVGQTKDETQPAVPVPPGPVPASQIKPGPPTPIAVKKDELGDDENWEPKWDVMIEENLPLELLSSRVKRAVRPFCPRFESLSAADKRSFWAYFFQALAGAEAGLNPTTNVRHTDPEVAVTDPITHRITRQEGLLQLTYEDSDRYGCDFDWEQDKQLPEHDASKTILQPKNNLMCGIKILKNQLIDLDQPLLWRKSYWSTLRPGTVSYRVFAKQMTNAPMACGARPAGAKKKHEGAEREVAATPPASQP